MIPSLSKLRGKVCVEHTKTILTNSSSYFSIAEEYVELQNTFITETIIDKINLWIDMVIYPIYTFISSIFSGEAPGLMSFFSIKKCVELWQKWFRYKELTTTICEWKTIVSSIGGPFITTNDPTYHVFVYADAMTRLHSALLTTTEKCAKRL
jgi:hypothetical protein